MTCDLFEPCTGDCLRLGICRAESERLAREAHRIATAPHPGCYREPAGFDGRGRPVFRVRSAQRPAADQAVGWQQSEARHDRRPHLLGGF